MRSCPAACIALMLLAATSAFADSDGGGASQDQPAIGLLYAGAGVTRERLSNFVLNSNPQNTRGYPDVNATSWKALFGVRPLPMFALEATYLGTASSSASIGTFSAKSETHAFAGYAVGFIQRAPGSSLDLFGKIGFSHWTQTAAGTIAGGESDNGTGFTWGLGFQVLPHRVGGRLEYENLRLTQTLHVVSLSLIVNLL